MLVTRLIDDLGYDNLNRPCKDLYFMNMAFAVNKRSLDPATKHGAVAVDMDGGVITTGYNSPVGGSIDENVPLDRPEKYYYCEHSERNLIYISAKKGRALENSTFYVTGFPCIECMRGLIQVGCVRLVYGPLQAMMCLEKDYIDRYNILLSGQSMIVEKFKYKESLLKMSPEIAEQIADRPDIDIQYNV